MALRPDALIDNLDMLQFAIGVIACCLWLLFSCSNCVIDHLPK
ncbi:hypothetical protein [Colwellia ponticola]|nr:hypothetical protein [Colwellia ponticola]